MTGAHNLLRNVYLCCACAAGLDTAQRLPLHLSDGIRRVPGCMQTVWPCVNIAAASERKLWQTWILRPKVAFLYLSDFLSVFCNLSGAHLQFMLLHCSAAFNPLRFYRSSHAIIGISGSQKDESRSSQLRRFSWVLL